MPKLEARKIAKKYVGYLKEKKFPFTKVYLFGSQAKGKAHEWSDIDICVVSDRFKGKNWDKYEKDLWHLRRDIDIRISPIGISVDEFNDLSPLAYEVKKTGIEIA